MYPKTGLSGSNSLSLVDSSSQSVPSKKETLDQKSSNIRTTVHDDSMVAASMSGRTGQQRTGQQRALQQRTVRPKEDTCFSHNRFKIFNLIQEQVLKKIGTVIDANQQRLIFNVDEKKLNNPEILSLVDGYHALLSEILEDTSIPDLIRSEKLVPIAREGDNKQQIILEFQHADDIYIHTLYGKEVALETKHVSASYNPRALEESDSSMLRVGMEQCGFTDGTPRYIFTTGLGPCICVTFFDKSQNTALLGHYLSIDFTPEKLSKVFEFCRDKKMKNLECHIVGGTYDFLGVNNGFLILRNILASNGIPIKQMFVGDTTDRPQTVMVDTKDMTLYRLPFNTLQYPDYFRTSRLFSDVRQLAGMPLVTKNFTRSLLTGSFDASTSL